MSTTSVFQIIVPILYAILLNLITVSGGRLATQEDFNYIGHFLSTVYSVVDETLDHDTRVVEYDILDHEEWWGKKEARSLVLPTPVYRGDSIKLLELMSNHNNWDRSSAPSSDLKMEQGESLVDTILAYIPEEKRNKKPFLCLRSCHNSNNQKQSGGCDYLPLRLTILGDSHTGVFDVAALRVKHMNVTTIVSATMYGLKNLNSTTQAATKFRDVIEARRQVDPITTSSSSESNFQHDRRKDTSLVKRNILVLNIGDCDVQGRSWRKYLANETIGIQMSLSSLNNYLKEHVEMPGGYGRVVLVLVPPPTIKNQTEAIKQRSRDYLMTSYEEKVEAIFKFNEALRSFCAEKLYCSILDIYPKVWNVEQGEVYRPYVNRIRADTHLVQNRVFGVVLEQLRRTLKAEWCVDDSEKKTKQDGGQGLIIIEEVQQLPSILNSSSGIRNNSKIAPSPQSSIIGFEPILIRVHCWIDGNPFYFLLNVVHYLTPRELVHQTALGHFISGDEPAKVKLVVKRLFNDQQQQKQLETLLIQYLGKSWGMQHLWDIPQNVVVGRSRWIDFLDKSNVTSLVEIGCNWLMNSSIITEFKRRTTKTMRYHACREEDEIKQNEDFGVFDEMLSFSTFRNNFHFQGFDFILIKDTFLTSKDVSTRHLLESISAASNHHAKSSAASWFGLWTCAAVLDELAKGVSIQRSVLLTKVDKEEDASSSNIRESANVGRRVEIPVDSDMTKQKTSLDLLERDDSEAVYLSPPLHWFPDLQLHSSSISTCIPGIAVWSLHKTM